jgi:hypothetical protein
MMSNWINKVAGDIRVLQAIIMLPEKYVNIDIRYGIE